MIYLKKFNEGIRCDYCNGEGREPSCHMCGKVYDYSDDYSDDETVNANSKFDSIKTDLTSKFGELNFSTDHKEFLKTAI